MLFHGFLDDTASNENPMVNFTTLAAFKIFSLFFGLDILV
jgi:hypothetical protein